MKEKTKRWLAAIAILVVLVFFYINSAKGEPVNGDRPALKSIEVEPKPAQPNFCVSRNQAVDVVALLEASEKDIRLLKSCRVLVNDLKQAVINRDVQLDAMTAELIKAKKEIIKYEANAATWRKVAWYSVILGGVGIALVLIQ